MDGYDQYVLEVARRISKWTDQQRVEFFDVLTSEFCRDCGREKEAREGCSCTNDE